MVEASPLMENLTGFFVCPFNHKIRISNRLDGIVKVRGVSQLVYKVLNNSVLARLDQLQDIVGASVGSGRAKKCLLLGLPLRKSLWGWVHTWTLIIRASEAPWPGATAL
ncbi:hypothetical protein CPAR01_00748 [Colletotrichum paranaense]|uniref:Uncharacterized protein n=1 Tax=Colletotrichum paranaense TaxID=1914294 RepID=A0ABQ9T4R7_9PEZI|nr:uncharacterized protein CPAR01_00748 [Colletotrichum paranaense]KAK1546781.1 hypothetical protein CPAR01_00748 [Colletotrichum paranaense]